MLSDNAEEIQENLLKSLIYYILFSERERNIEGILELLEYEKKMIENLFNSNSPKDKAVVYFNKIKDMNYIEYDNVTKQLKSKLKEAKTVNNLFPVFCCDVEIDIYAEKIIKKNKMKTMEEYVRHLMDIDDSRGFFVKGYRLFYYEQKIEKGKRYLIESAIKGNSLASFYLGKIFFEGIDGKINKNYVYAEDYLTQFIKAENENDELYFMIKEAKIMLGKLYFLGGNGVVSQYNLSLKIFKEIDEACYDKYVLLYIGTMYIDGLVKEKNEKLGFEYLKKSAEQNVSKAQIGVAYAYINGKGTEKNTKRALYWIERAVNNNYNDAKYLLGITYYYSDGEFNIEKDRKYGKKLLEEAAKTGCKEAIKELEYIRKYESKYNKQDINNYIEDRSQMRKKWFDN